MEFSGGVAPVAAEAVAPLAQPSAGLDLEVDTSSGVFHLAVDNFNVLAQTNPSRPMILVGQLTAVYGGAWLQEY